MSMESMHLQMLTEQVTRTRTAYEMFQMANTAGLDEIERTRLTLRYQVAKHAYYAAAAALERAIKDEVQS